MTRYHRFNRLRMSIVCTAAYIFSAPVFASTYSCESLFVRNNRSHQIWDVLQKSESLLVNQKSINGKDGLCGPACLLNSIQFLRVSAGLAPIEDIQSNFEALVSKVIDGEGGTSIPHLIFHLKTLLSQNFGLADYKIKFDTYLDAYNPEMMALPEVTEIKHFDLSRLSPGEGQVKMLVAMVMVESRGITLGSHIQIVRSYDGTLIHLIDSNAPNIIYKARRHPELVDNIISDETRFPVNALSYQMTSIRKDNLVPIGILTIIPAYSKAR